MKRNTLTIILLVVGVLLLVGSIFLYRALTLPPQTAVPVGNGQSSSSIFDSSPDPAAETPATPPAAPEPSAAPTPASVTVTESPYPKATDFVFQDQYGKEYRLSDLYGKPTIINFFATWCPPCQAELPYFNEAYAIYQDQINFLVLDLVDSGSETVDNGLAFIASNGYSFPLYFDSYGEGYGIFGTGYIPVTVLLSADGGVIDTHVGGLSQQELAEMIERLLND